MTKGWSRPAAFQLGLETFFIWRRCNPTVYLRLGCRGSSLRRGQLLFGQNQSTYKSEVLKLLQDCFPEPERTFYPFLAQDSGLRWGTDHHPTLSNSMTRKVKQYDFYFLYHSVMENLKTTKNNICCHVYILKSCTVYYFKPELLRAIGEGPKSYRLEIPGLAQTNFLILNNLIVFC